ncbi:MAG: DUF3300 domain-containing protein [Woeseiaceae bacterium]|nr:DUF3300 domain-containing protein [Woeseiaceae bacterium]MDX2608992.1 DUF3300 domain-containing protein [Woeseiaceae bacterium]
MSTQTLNLKHICLLAAIIAWPTLGSAQVPVDESGNPVAEYAPETAAGSEELTILSGPELEGIIGPIALYPDDLLAIVLPASTYPLQIVQAARFLKDLKSDPSLKPDPDWDDSVVALSNYPEVIEMMADDLDWTWRLGEAVVAQQPAVIAAIERFRDRAYAAGNLKSDEHQTIAQEDGVIQITPVEEDVIYVPYYEPERVVVYQPRPVYYYYPRPYPVYYYPYPSGYAFNHGFFWGITSAYSIGWYTDRLHVYHHSYHGHPYYGHSYRDNWWYRRPNIHVHNSIYVNRNNHVTSNRYRDGDYWRPQHRRTVRSSDQRITRTRYFPNPNTASTNTTRSSAQTPPTRGTVDAPRTTSRGTSGKQINRNSVTRRDERRVVAPRDNESREPGERKRQSPKADFAFRERPTITARTTATRPSSARRSTQGRELQARVSEPRKSQVRKYERQPQVRQSAPRQPQVRQSTPRQTQVARVPSKQSRVTRAPSRQSDVRQSQPREVQSRRSSQPQRSESQSRPSKQSRSSKQSGSSKPQSSSRGDSRSGKTSSSSRSRRDRG